MSAFVLGTVSPAAILTPCLYETPCEHSSARVERYLLLCDQDEFVPEDAENYDPTATVDDDSCTFAPCSDDCPADLDGDGQIGTSDLLDLLGSFGVTCP